MTADTSEFDRHEKLYGKVVAEHLQQVRERGEDPEACIEKYKTRHGSHWETFFLEDMAFLALLDTVLTDMDKIIGQVETRT